MFALLCGRFKKEFGHTKVPVFYTGYNNLGRWAKHMRDGIRNEEPWMDEVRDDSGMYCFFTIAVMQFGGSSQVDTLDEDLEETVVDEMKHLADASTSPIPANLAGKTWLVGDTFLRTVYTIYDYDGEKMGFAKLKQ